MSTSTRSVAAAIAAVVAVGGIAAAVAAWRGEVAAAAQERQRVLRLLQERRGILRTLDLGVPSRAADAPWPRGRRLWPGAPFLSGKCIVASPDMIDSTLATEPPEDLRPTEAPDVACVIFIDLEGQAFRVTIADVRSGWVTSLPEPCGSIEAAMREIRSLPRTPPFVLGDLHAYADIQGFPGEGDPALLQSGRILPVDASDGSLDSIWRLLPEARRATRAEDVDVVARLEWTQETVGYYNQVSRALQWVCRATLIDWRSRRVIRGQEIRGSAPPVRIEGLQETSGSFPAEDVARFVQTGT